LTQLYGGPYRWGGCNAKSELCGDMLAPGEASFALRSDRWARALTSWQGTEYCDCHCVRGDRSTDAGSRRNARPRPSQLASLFCWLKGLSIVMSPDFFRGITECDWVNKVRFTESDSGKPDPGCSEKSPGTATAGFAIQAIACMQRVVTAAKAKSARKA